MEDKLITLAIHTYQKAQIIKTLLESEGIEVCLHNVNLISPMVSSGVRVRIKERDLPAALKFIEDIHLEEKEEKKEEQLSKKILIPVDFSDYSIRACEIGFNYAKEIQAEVIIMHVYSMPFSLNTAFLSDILSTVTEEETATLQRRTKEDLEKFITIIQNKIQESECADIPFSTLLCEGLPEEEIVSYCRKQNVNLIVMGTRGKDQKDVDLIGSVTAEVIERIKIPVFAIPEKTHFRNFSDLKRIAFGTSFDPNDLLAFDTLFKMFRFSHVEYYLFHITHKQDAGNEVKMESIKRYFTKQYPAIQIRYIILDAQDFVLNLEYFIRDNKIDIITIPTHKRNLFSRIFNPSITRKMLFHTDTPLLALRS